MFGLLPNALFTNHQGKSGGRGLSPRLWAQAYGQALSPDGFANAYWFADDFANFGAINPGAGGTTTGVNGNGYGYFTDTVTSAGSIKQLGTTVGGVVQLATGAADNYDTIMTTGGNTGAIAQVSTTAGSNKLLIFEARFRTGQVTNAHNIFIGLSEVGLAATDSVFTDAGALADKTFIGFWNLEADGTSLKFGYKKNGQTVQTVGTYGTALAANTWYKIGLVYDPAEASSKRIKFFVDNVEQSSYVTATNLAAATFPNGDKLALTAGLKNGAAAAKTFDMDWWALFQQG